MGTGGEGDGDQGVGMEGGGGDAIKGVGLEKVPCAYRQVEPIPAGGGWLAQPQLHGATVGCILTPPLSSGFPARLHALQTG